MDECERCANFKPKEKEKPRLVVDKQCLTGGNSDYIVLKYGEHRIELDAPTEYTGELSLFINHDKVYAQKLS
jgi:hypothetical protein